MASQGGGEVVKPTFVRAGEASFNDLHFWRLKFLLQRDN